MHIFRILYMNENGCNSTSKLQYCMIKSNKTLVYNIYVIKLCVKQLYVQFI